MPNLRGRGAGRTLGCVTPFRLPALAALTALRCFTLVAFCVAARFLDSARLVILWLDALPPNLFGVLIFIAEYPFIAFVIGFSGIVKRVIVGHIFLNVCGSPLTPAT